MSHSIDFLQGLEPEPRQRSHKRSRVILLLLALIVILIGVWIGAVVLAVGRVAAASLDARDALFAARDAAIALEFDAAEADLETAEARLGDAESGLRLLATVSFVPWVKTQVDATRSIVTSGRQTIDALKPIVSLGGEIVRLTGLTTADLQAMTEGLHPDLTFDDLPTETKRQILLRLANSADELELTDTKISLAIDELNRIPRGEVAGPIVDVLTPLGSRLGELQTAVHTLSIGARLLPEFAGLDADRTFLLLFLNNTELRPGGGFIGTYGTLAVRDGEIVRLTSRDSYALDNAAAASVTRTPPAALRTYLGAEKLCFRDRNWSPDFAQSAPTITTIFNDEAKNLTPEAQAEIQSPTFFAGMVGITPTFVAELLRLTGPIEASGQTFTADNFADLLEYQVEVGYVGQNLPEHQRKDVVSDVMLEMKKRLFDLPLSSWVTLLGLAEDALNEKQIVLFSFDPATESVIERVGWGGHVHADTPDAVLAVDANLASLKSDPVVKRSLTHQIFQNIDGEWIARDTLRYEHTGAFTWKTTRYRSYMRLFIPAGSELIRTEGSLLNDKLHNPNLLPAPTDVGSDLGFTVFGTFVSVEPGETRDLVFEYKLAPVVVEAIASGSYELTVLKQIGAANYGLTLDLGFDKKVSSAVPPEPATEWGDHAYRLNTALDEDRTFTVDL